MVPDRRPRWTTTPNPGAHGAMRRVTRFSPIRFSRATVFGMGIARTFPVVDSLILRGSTMPDNPGCSHGPPGLVDSVQHYAAFNQKAAGTECAVRIPAFRDRAETTIKDQPNTVRHQPRSYTVQSGGLERTTTDYRPTSINTFGHCGLQLCHNVIGRATAQAEPGNSGEVICPPPVRE